MPEPAGSPGRGPAGRPVVVDVDRVRDADRELVVFHLAVVGGADGGQAAVRAEAEAGVGGADGGGRRDGKVDVHGAVAEAGVAACAIGDLLAGVLEAAVGIEVDPGVQARRCLRCPRSSPSRPVPLGAMVKLLEIVTPSSSSGLPLLSSPSALAVGWPSVSASRLAPSIGPAMV